MTRRICTLLGFALVAAPAFAQQEIPKASDPRLVVELVAQSPDIVHPVSCDFDHKGRLLVIESHTHFAPKDYKGPKFDRIRAFDVKTGKATTFFEGTRHTMDLAVHPDGSVYIATRNEILRLRDTKGTGVADEKSRIVFLDTKGDYPHNGLSGLCFDSKGDLLFGMGENLGAKYTLIGSDGVKFSGEGDGGHIFYCTADGKKLRRVATGFWNPFGICRDIYGRTFCVDNDPDQAPPCRMLHIVEGGDYGFRFCYGRSGKHPFQSWHGTLPGTLPMMTGVGESPCEILSYESDGLPKEYLGQLLVTSWADHRVERYKVVPHGASFKAERQPFVQGGNNFRPVGLCTAPDGSLYVTDWVKSDYTLHGKGAIWRIRWKDAPKAERPDDPKEAILSTHRPVREAAAKKLASQDMKFLTTVLDNSDPRARVSALSALINARRAENARLKVIVVTEHDMGAREMAVRALVGNTLHFYSSKGLDPFFAKPHPPTIRAELARAIRGIAVGLLDHDDPFLRQAAIQHIAGDELLSNDFADPTNATPFSVRQRTGIVLANQSSQRNGRTFVAKRFLSDSDETVRFLAVKWIADEKLAEYRKDVEKLMSDSKLSVRMYVACATALARIDGKNVDERSLADYFAKRLADDATPAAQRAMLLRQVPATHSKLTVDLLTKLLKSDDAALKMEAVRAMVEHPSTKRHGPLLEVFENPKLGTHMQAYALLGLLDRPFEQHVPTMLPFVTDPKSPLQADAERALLGAVKAPGQVFERQPQKDRPPAKDLDAWLKRLEGKADAEAGARIFFHPKLASCSRCHRIDGRGQDVGPDLSNIGNTDRRRILESILQPSNTVAPHYVAWHLETADGKVKNGMLLHTQLDEYTFLDTKGERFNVKTGNLVEQRPLTTSIMPDGLVERMTDQEVRDLVAYLQTRK